MERPTYQALLNSLRRTKTAQFRSDPDANEAILDAVVETVEAILEKLAEEEKRPKPNFVPLILTGATE